VPPAPLSTLTRRGRLPDPPGTCSYACSAPEPLPLPSSHLCAQAKHGAAAAFTRQPSPSCSGSIFPAQPPERCRSPGRVAGASRQGCLCPTPCSTFPCRTKPLLAGGSAVQSAGTRGDAESAAARCRAPLTDPLPLPGCPRGDGLAAQPSRAGMAHPRSSLRAHSTADARLERGSHQRGERGFLGAGHRVSAGSARGR